MFTTEDSEGVFFTTEGVFLPRRTQRTRRVFFYHGGHRGHGECFFTTEDTEGTET